MRKHSISILFAAVHTLMATLPAAAQTAPTTPGGKPNIIFVVADDMGNRDTGYSGNPVVKTPHLDAMAAEGLRFDKFYSAHATCSPGRMAILTGRTPLRARMVTTVGPMQAGEVTVAMALKTAGYETAHFGKWGVGTGGTHPLKVGFDEAIWGRGFFDIGASFFVGDSDKRDERPVGITGESSLATMDLALDFIRKRADRNQPFFVQVSFGSPHSPHVAAEEFKKLYPNLTEKEQNLWGEVSGLDAAVGKLRQELRRLNIAGNTLLWFVSDNGGISQITDEIDRKGKIGAKTIGLLEWPDKITSPVRNAMPVSHMDMYPTVLDIVGVKWDHQPVIDGISLLPLFEGRMESRPKPLGFTAGRYANKEDPKLCEVTNGAWIDGRFLLRYQIAAKRSKTATIALYDIVTDPAEQTDLAAEKPETVKEMLKALMEWQESVKASFAGKDYLPTQPESESFK